MRRVYHLHNYAPVPLVDHQKRPRSISLPDFTDVVRIVSWFGKNEGLSVDYEGSDPAWDQFIREMHTFENERHYILICTEFRQDKYTDLSALGRIPWVSVLDFDPNSEQLGLLAASKLILESQSRRSVHLVTSQDRPTINLRIGTYWYFARGLSGRAETMEMGPWRVWQKGHSGKLSEHLQRLAAASTPRPVTFLVLWYDSALTRHLQSTLDEVVKLFGDVANIVIVTHDPASLRSLAEDTEAFLLQIPLHQLCSGLASLPSPRSEEANASFSLPSSSGAPISIPIVERSWIEEEVELIHLGAGLVSPPNRAIGRDFLRGAEVSWYELGLSYDIERDLAKKTERRVETELHSRSTVRVNLYHAPGAGGTTLARRILWNLHHHAPCGILRRTNPPDTAERLFRLTSLTGLSFLLLVDGAEVSERQVDELNDYLKSRQIPVVLLQILRRFNRQAEGRRAFYLDAELSPSEASRFAHVYAREVPQHRGSIEALLVTVEERLRTAFYFGLHTFLEEFQGLENYVAMCLLPLTREQKEIVGYLALAHHYAQRPLRIQVFADQLGLPQQRVINLEDVLPKEALNLLISVEQGVWRTTHDLIAVEVLKQLLWPTSSDRRNWTQNLSTWGMRFAELCRGSTPVASDEMLEVVRRTFIYRDNSELLGTEKAASSQFAQLIQDIPSNEGGLLILQQLTKLYPDEPHFWAHLGRFLTIVASLNF